MCWRRPAGAPHGVPMTSLHRLPAPLTALAARRGGLVARRELLAAGLTPSASDRVARRTLAVHPGVYDLTRHPGAPPSTRLADRAWAAHLHAGPDSVVAGRAALVLHGARGLEADVVDLQMLLPDGVPQTAARARQVRSPGPGVRIARQQVPRPTTTRQGLPLLAVEEAVLDLTGTPRDAVSLATLACQQRLTTPDRLRAHLRARRRHPQRDLLDGLLTDVAEGATSVLEVRFRRDVVARHGLPPGVGQLRVPGTGRLADRGYPKEGVLVELDSIAFHSGTARSTDLDRDAAHLAGGWVTVRFGWAQVTADACASAARLRDVLRARGGSPTWRPCPRCP